MATGAAIVGAIGLTVSVAAGAKKYKDQEEAVEEAENQAAADLQTAQVNDRKLRTQAAEDAKIASKEKVSYGIDDEEESGTYNDFTYTPTAGSSLGGGTTSGLGFA